MGSLHGCHDDDSADGGDDDDDGGGDDAHGEHGASSNDGDGDGAGQHHLIMIRFAMLKAVHMIEMEVRAWVTVGVTKVGTS